MTVGLQLGQTWVSDPRYELNELRRPDFTVLRKGGLDPDEVDAYVLRLEQLAKDFKMFTGELETQLRHAKAGVEDIRRTERQAVDQAMVAVLDAKERIIVDAHEQAWEIEEGARRAAAGSTGEGPAALQKIQELELELTAGRGEIERLTAQLSIAQERSSRLESDAQRLSRNRIADPKGSASSPASEGAASVHDNDNGPDVAAASSKIITDARARAMVITADADKRLKASQRALDRADARAKERLQTAAEEAERLVAESRTKAAHIVEAATAQAEEATGEAAEHRRQADALLHAAVEKQETATRAARERSAEIIAHADTRAAATLERASAEAKSIIANAKQRGTALVAAAEAKARKTEAATASRLAAAGEADESTLAEATAVAEATIEDARARAGEIIRDAARQSADAQREVDALAVERAETIERLAIAKEAVRRSAVSARQAIIDAQAEATEIIAAAEARATALAAGADAPNGP